MGLSAYNKKRDFDVTREPAGKPAKKKGHAFVVQEHAATRHHYDFRLEHDGVLKSWAVPKGPSMIAGDKRLAVEVEDHPVSYGHFEGEIPEGEYGAGSVRLWDEGTWEPVGDVDAGLKKGELKFRLEGQRLHGGFVLVRLRARGDERRNNWLLIHERDSASAAAVTAAKSAKLPRDLEPALCTLVKEVPEGKDWVYETKLDGYRFLGVRDGDDVRLITRNGKDWSEKFPHIVEDLRKLPSERFVVDGELCAIDDGRKSSFQNLQNALRGGRDQHLRYFLFDLLFRDDEDIREQPLLERKKSLEVLIGRHAKQIELVKHVAARGEDVFTAARDAGLEGIVAKRVDSKYQSGKRTTDWLKIRCDKRQELVIVGFSAPKGSRTGLGALLLGVYDGDTLRYAGRVGTGFSDAVRGELFAALKKREVKSAAAEGVVRTRDVTWVKPEMVAEVRFTEWTRDGHLRHPVFLGLRLDKSAADVVREKPKLAKRVTAAKAKVVRRKAAPAMPERTSVTITHGDRVIDEASGATKGDLARYFAAMSEHVLAFGKDRPLAVVRCPTGLSGPRFFAKNAWAGVQGKVKRSPNHQKPYLWMSDASDLVTFAQFSAIELHGWQCGLDLEHPDMLVMDLDPDEGLPWRRIADAALELRERFTALGMTSFVKTTGGKGLHVVVPLEPVHNFAELKAFTEALAHAMVKDSPRKYVATISKAARKGKIFIDYLRNGEGATAILPYCPRAREGLPVAMPIAWKDVPHVDPAQFRLEAALEHVRKRRTDPWAKYLDSPQRLPAAFIEAFAGGGK